MIKRIPMSSKTRWHRARSQDVTASVVAALFGSHPFMSRFELWAEKSGRAKPDTTESAAMFWGSAVENIVVDLLRKQNPGWTIIHNTAPGDYWRDEEFRIGGTPDILAYDPGRGEGVIQIKVPQLRTFRDGWKQDDGTIEAPLYAALQASTEAYLTGAKWAMVAALPLGAVPFVHQVDVPLIPGVVDAVKAAAVEFWDFVNSGDDMDPDFSLDTSTIDRLYARDGGEEIDLSRDNRTIALVKQLALEKAKAKETAGAISTIEAEIKHRMKGAAIAYLPGGDKITWREQRRDGHYIPTSRSRVLRVPTLS